MMVWSASIDLSLEKYGHSYYFLNNQIWHGILPGLILGIIAYFIPYRFWQKTALPLLFLTILMLVLVFIPGIGVEHGGSRRWLNLGPFSPQPSEFLKLTFVIYLAAWLSAKRQAVKSFSQTMVPFVILMSVVSLLLLLEPDIGSLGIIAFTALAVYFLAGAKISHLSLIGVAALAAFWSLIKLFSHAANRWQVFLHPELDPQGIGYQVNQALLALGSGGFFGLGLGQSLQKFKYLPEPATDSIVAVIGEEFGFFGLFCLLMLFIIFAFRAFRIAKNAPDDFARLLAGGLASWILIQALINIMAICGLVPLTGITLPFISLGGSSLTITLIAMGILLNISKYANR